MQALQGLGDLPALVLLPALYRLIAWRTALSCSNSATTVQQPNVPSGVLPFRQFRCTTGEGDRMDCGLLGLGRMPFSALRIFASSQGSKWMVAPLLMLCGELLALPQEVHSRHHHWVLICLVCWLARPKALTQPSFGATTWPARRHSLGWIFFWYVGWPARRHGATILV